MATMTAFWKEKKKTPNNSRWWCSQKPKMNETIHITSYRSQWAQRLKTLSENCNHPEWKQIDFGKHQPISSYSLSLALVECSIDVCSMHVVFWLFKSFMSIQTFVSFLFSIVRFVRFVFGSMCVCVCFWNNALFHASRRIHSSLCHFLFTLMSLNTAANRTGVSNKDTLTHYWYHIVFSMGGNESLK